MENRKFFKLTKLIPALVAFICCLILPVMKSNASELEQNALSLEEMLRMSGEQSGVRNVTLMERYIEEYGLYEESLGDTFFFYSNVGNGGFTFEPVTFEIPNNITCIFEKDGAGYTYTGKISKKGNYVVRVSAVSGETTYSSTFRFSIREKPADLPETQPQTQTSSDNSQELIISNHDIADLDISTGGSDSSEPEITLEDLQDLGEDDEISDADIERMIEEAGINDFGGNEYSEETTEAFLFWGLEEGFSSEKSAYSYTLESGDVIYANIPMGAIVNEGVKMEFPETIVPKIYKDGVLLETKETDEFEFTEDGFYQVRLEGNTLSYAMNYQQGEAAPFITFRIVKHPVKNMDYFTAPHDAKIIAAGTKKVDFLNEEGEKTLNLDSFFMEEDDTYCFKIRDNTSGGYYDVVIEKDTVAPLVNVPIQKGKAYPQYGSSDIATVDLYKNGLQVPDANVNTISGKGTYKLVATDLAGNVTECYFAINSYMSGISIAFIIVFVLLILAAFVYLRLQRNKMRVR